MISNLILALELNVLCLLCVFLLWGNSTIRFIFRRSFFVLIAFNIALFLTFTLTDFSYQAFIQSASNSFERVENWYQFAVPLLFIFTVALLILLYQHLNLLFEHRNRHYIFICIGLLIIAVGLWLPFGLDIIGEKDTWVVKHFFVNGKWIDDSASKANELFTRVSTVLTTTVAHFIDPDGFRGYTILQVIFVWLKGLVVFGILKKLNVRDYLALMIAILFMVYPTAQPIISIRNFVIFSAIVLILLSVYTFLRYIESPTKINFLVFCIIMFVAITSNEYAFLHVICFPFLLTYHTNTRSRWIKLSAIWYLIPIWYILHYYSVLRFGTETPYGVDYLQGEGDLLAPLLDVVRFGFHSLYVLFIDGWRLALLPLNLTFAIMSIVITTVVILSIRHLLKRSQPDKSANFPIVQWLVISLAIIFLASTLFALTKQDAFEWRVHAIGSLGASIFLGAVVVWIGNLFRPQHRNIVMLTVFASFFLLAYHSALVQNQLDYQTQQYQRNFLKLPASLEDANSDGTWIYIFDMSDEELSNALQLFTKSRYRTSGINIFLRNGKVSSSFLCSPSTTIKNSTCRAIQDGIRLQDLNYTVRYDDMVLLFIEPDGQTRLLEEFPYDYWNVDFSVQTYEPYQYIELE